MACVNHKTANHYGEDILRIYIYIYIYIYSHVQLPNDNNVKSITTYSDQFYWICILTRVPLSTPNNEIRKYKTRNNTNLHLATVNITKYYKGHYISGLKAFNHLPLHIKSLANDMKSFKTSVKRFLYHHSFCSIEEYYEYNDDKGM